MSMAYAEVEVSSEKLLGWIEGVDETKERTREEDWRMEVGRRRGELDSEMAFSFNLPPLLELDCSRIPTRRFSTFSHRYPVETTCSRKKTIRK